MATNIGPRIGIDGEGEYRKQLQQIIAETKTLKSEMGALTSSFDKDNKSLKDNANQRKLLNEQIKKQKEALQGLKDGLEKSKAATGENSTTTQRWQQAVNNATADLNKLNAELDNLPNGLQVVGSKMQDVGSQIKGFGDGVKGVGETLTTHVTAPIVGAGIASAKLASDYEENLNKVGVAFGDNAAEVTAWADTATSQFGLSKNAALEATSLFGDMGTSMGLTTGDAAEMATSLAGLAGDLSSFKNVGIDQAMTALNGVFTGETESLKTLGVVMTETNLEEFAAGIGKSYKEMSQAEKVTLRYQYVLANTKNAQGDYARTSDGAANSIRTMQAELDNLAVAFGQELLPVVTPIIQSVTDLIHQFGALDEETKKNIITIAGIAAAAGPVLVVIGSVIGAIGTIVSAIGGAVTAIGGIVSAFSAAGGAAGVLGTAIAALTGPVGIAIGAVAGLTAAGIAIYKNWDTIKAKAAELAETIGTKFEEIKTAAQEKWQAANEAVNSAMESIKTKVSEGMATAKEVAAGYLQQLVAEYEKSGGGMSGAIQAAMTTAKQIFDDAYAYIDQITNGKLTEVVTTVTTIMENVKSAFSEKIDAAKQLISDGLEAIKALFNIELKLPDIKLPHFKVSGSFSLDPPSVPSFGIEWYSKAMKDGMILDSATIFGAANGRLLGGGEAGPEAIVGVESLMNMIQNAVNSAGTTVNQGDITINVMQRDGEDSEAFAHRVADIINSDVQRGRAAWA